MPVQYVGNGVYINVPSPAPYRPPVAPYNPSLYQRNQYYVPRPAASYRPWWAWTQPTYRPPSYLASKMSYSPPKPTTTAAPKPAAAQTPAQYVGQGTYIGAQGQTSGTWGSSGPSVQPTLAEQHQILERNRGLQGQEEWYAFRANEALKNMPTGYAPAPQAEPVAPASYGGGYGYGGYGGYGGGGSSYKTPYYQAQPKQSYYRGSPVPFSPDVASWLYQLVNWSI